MEFPSLEAAQRENTIYEEPIAFSPVVAHDDGWSKQNLLSLDGGGIRGLWSLFVLERLMEEIAAIEESLDEVTNHSFLPQPWPSSLKTEPFTNDEQRRFQSASGHEEQLAALSLSRRYFPCHYFDCIGGTSTGALIAIMLGRFRMSVPECIKEYRTLGQKVFGKPRHLTTLNFGIISREKFDAEKLREVFEDVTVRRSEREDVSHQRMKFPIKRGVCRTFVTSIKSESDQKALGRTYIIRSYNHTRRRRAIRTATGQTNRSNTEIYDISNQTGTAAHGIGVAGPSRSNTNNISRGVNHVATGLTDASNIENRVLRKRKSGTDQWDAQDFEIWEVARAATAAPLYFEPLKIRVPLGAGHMIFKDGGFNYANNPTKEGLREIEEEYGSSAIGIVVSVGTARLDQPPGKQKLLPFLPVVTEMTQMATDPEKIHEEVETLSKSEVFPFPYFRLNHPGQLGIKLDEWKPRHGSSKKPSGSVTVNAIQQVFDNWAAQRDNINLLKNCATQLVRRRRARIAANDLKWERYAIGVKFRCRLQGCDREDDFLQRDQFCNHLRVDHGRTNEGEIQEEANARKKDWLYQ